LSTVPLRAGTGVSKSSPEEALEEAAEDLDEVNAVLCAFSPRHDPDEVRRALVEYLGDGDYMLLGFSTAGNITDDGFSQGTVAVLALELSNLIALGMAIGKGLSEDPHGVASRTLDRAARSVKVDVSAALAPVATGIVTGSVDVIRHSLVDVLLLVDGLCCLDNPNASVDVLRGILNRLGPEVGIVGGMTADEYEFERTYLFDRHGVYEDAIAIVTIYSSLKRGHAVDHGYAPDTDPMVARTDGVTVTHLDDRPALDAYEDHVGRADQETLLKYPIGFHDPGPRPYHLIRTPIDADEEDRTLQLVAQLPDGTPVQIMAPDNLEASIRNAAELAIKNAGEPRELALVTVFNCAARHLVVDTDEALDILRDLIGEDVPVFGFNCYGEYGLTPSGKFIQHNQTVAVHVIGNEVVGH